jgi:hypothetical protein
MTTPMSAARTREGLIDDSQWDGDWGIAGKQVQRFYLADVTYGGVGHLFVAVVYPEDPADIETFASRGEKHLLATVRVPASSA